MDGFGGTIWGTAPTWQVAATGTAAGGLLALSAVTGGAWMIWFPIAVGFGWAAWRAGRLRAAPWALGGAGGVLVAQALSVGVAAWAAAGIGAIVLALLVGGVQLARWKRS